ncbi:MAG: hypothetical protein QNJ16_05690, partial [Rhodobacter sp.]|nr:hypothetical protein [Rhodobacter sp.]
MAEVVAEQSELLCPTCAGQCVFDPAKGGLTCQSCGNTHAIEHPEAHDGAAEYDFDSGAPGTDTPVRQGARAHHCETCGGDVVFTGMGLSDRCPYCDGPVVLGAEDSGYRTMALIPFKMTGADAQALARNWVARRYAAPGDLDAVVAEARVAGLYAPFWTFDSREAVRYWAKYTTGSGKNRRTHRTSGSLRIDFEDLLAPASHHVTPLIRDGILHDFDPDRLRPYRTGYLAGFAAERHHQTVAEGLRANKRDKTLLIRNRVKK